jgi:class 3 adenylate cyclase
VILFCDVCQFDLIVQEVQDGVLKFLDKLFRHYDKLCSEYGVQKIETVGKTYMAAAGLKSCEKELRYSSQLKPINRVHKYELIVRRSKLRRRW